MRVSTSMMFDQMAKGISNAASEVSRENQRLSNGKQRLSPADDPVNAAKSLQISEKLSRFDSSIRFSGELEDKFATMEGFMQGAMDELVNGKGILVEAGNQTLNQTELNALAQQVFDMRDNIRASLNGKLADGTFAFSGFSNTEPFPNTTSPASYVGDQGTNHFEFAGGQNIETNYPGHQFFQNNDILGKLTDLGNRLKTGDQSTIQSMIADLDFAMNSMSGSIAEMGARRNEMASVSSFSSSMKDTLGESLSNIDDLDYAKAISDLSKKQLVYQASIKAFSEVSQNNLFSLL